MSNSIVRNLLEAELKQTPKLNSILFSFQASFVGCIIQHLIELTRLQGLVQQRYSHRDTTTSASRPSGLPQNLFGTCPFGVHDTGKVPDTLRFQWEPAPPYTRTYIDDMWPIGSRPNRYRIVAKSAHIVDEQVSLMVALWAHQPRVPEKGFPRYVGDVDSTDIPNKDLVFALN